MTLLCFVVLVCVIAGFYSVILSLLLVVPLGCGACLVRYFLSAACRVLRLYMCLDPLVWSPRGCFLVFCFVLCGGVFLFVLYVPSNTFFNVCFFFVLFLLECCDYFLIICFLLSCFFCVLCFLLLCCLHFLYVLMFSLCLAYV